MVTSCLFGLFVFGEDLTLTYRFLTDEFFNYLYKTIRDRRDPSEDDNTNPEEIGLSIDDKILLHFSPLIGFCNQTYSRKIPIKRITLESNLQVYFDQIGKSKVMCMADGSFHTLVVLKTINLFKALIKFHIGAYPFRKCPIVNKSIDRISAALQYYLNHIMTNQSLLFESSEYLNINTLIRQQCTDACSIVNLSIQFPPTLILITCKDKIVHMQLNNEQNRPSNSDIFLLLLNNTSRSSRTQFPSQEQGVFDTMAHAYKTKSDTSIDQIGINIRENADPPLARRTISLPTTTSESAVLNDPLSVEVVFMRTSNKLLAPFTLYTIPLTNDISILIVVEWRNSVACSSLSELINQLNLCITQTQLSYKKLSNQVKSVESNITTRRYFESRDMPTNYLMRILNEAHELYRSIWKKTDGMEEDHPQSDDILMNLSEMSKTAIDIFHQSFLSSDDHGQRLTSSTNETNKVDSLTMQNLQNRLTRQLGDWFSFMEAKSQGNITISFCQHDFPGLVHFALIDRSRGRISTPVLFTDDYRNYLATKGSTRETDNIKEKKIIAFELECLTALQRGCTSYTMTDEFFTYNYTLRLQESNGASMRVYRPFIKTEPPGILHYDFYEKLAHENYATLDDQTSIACFELICVHLRFVPPNIVREHCEQLWPKLMELDE